MSGRIDSDELIAESRRLMLEHYREQTEKGDRIAILRALRFCARYQLLIPDWLDGALHVVTNSFFDLSASSLDEAFGVSVPTAKRLAADRRFRRKAWLIYNRVCERHTQGAAIDQLLFDEIGKECGISGASAKQYYYAIRKFMNGASAGPEQILQVLRKRPAK